MKTFFPCEQAQPTETAFPFPPQNNKSKHITNPNHEPPLKFTAQARCLGTGGKPLRSDLHTQTHLHMYTQTPLVPQALLTNGHQGNPLTWVWVAFGAAFPFVLSDYPQFPTRARCGQSLLCPLPRQQQQASSNHEVTAFPCLLGHVWSDTPQEDTRVGLYQDQPAEGLSPWGGTVLFVASLFRFL